MIENMNVQNGDMMTLVRVMNENTSTLDKRVENMFQQSNIIFNDIDERLFKIEKKTKINSKTIGKIGLAVLLIDGFLILTDRRIKKISERVKSLEDQVLVDKFFKKDEEDSLK